MHRSFVPSLLTTLLLSIPALAAIALPPADNTSLTEDEQQLIESFLGHAESFAKVPASEVLAEKLATTGPEALCWVDFRQLNCLNVAYELTHDPAYLEKFASAFAGYEAILSRGPDDYRGWYGPTLKNRAPADNPTLKVDEIQTNFRAIGALAKWIELARSDDTFAEANAATIERYRTLIEEHLFPKWDTRGHFVVIPGRGGVYRWLDYPVAEGVTLSFEKLSIIVDALLKLHRVTDNPHYLQRALQVGAWFKSNLTLVDDHYEWMSWVPAGRWDINPDKPDAWRVGWMAPDPNAAWYIASVSIAMNLYRHGLLFTEDDVRRLVNTQKTMCWNGDLEKPQYRAVNGKTSKWIKGRFLSPMLAHCDATLSQLAFSGPHHAQALAEASSPWKGATNAQDMIRERFLLGPIVATTPQPHLRYGTRFSTSADGQAFLAQIDRPVYPPGAVSPQRPSALYLLPSTLPPVHTTDTP